MSVHLRPFVVSLRRHNAMCGMALRYWLSTLTRRKPFGLSVPRPENTRQNMFSMNKWLKTPDFDGHYQPIVRDFQAAIPEFLDAPPRKYFQQPVWWMTRIFHQFDDVSLMAAQGIGSPKGRPRLTQQRNPATSASVCGWLRSCSQSVGRGKGHVERMGNAGSSRSTRRKLDQRYDSARSTRFARRAFRST